MTISGERRLDRPDAGAPSAVRCYPQSAWLMVHRNELAVVRPAFALLLSLFGSFGVPI
jgi:hypothetical protein